MSRRIFSKIIAGLMTAAAVLGSVSHFPAEGADTVYAAGIQPVKIDAAHFPDANFRAVISGKDYDRDGSGTLSAEEIGLTLNIYCEGKNIKSLKGVEYFVDLQGLWCKDNRIDSLDISNLSDLRGLWCSGNNLTSLDMTHNPELVWVYCYDCKLTSLDVSKNPKMAFIECNTNPLTGLDVTKNPELEHLTCGTCGLTKLDVSKNPKLSHLDAFSNKLKKLDVSQNTKLKRLDIWNNPGLGSIDISKNTGLQYYNCAYNGATKVDVSKNTELQKLICSYNSLTKLDLSHNPKLVYLDCACNSIGSLDLSKNTKLYFLQAFTNSFTTLDIGYNPYLIKTYNEGVKKDESAVCKGHSWTINYGGETSTGEDNIYFLCFDDAVTLLTTAKASAPTEEKYSELDPSVSESDLLMRDTVVETLYELAGSPSVSGLTSRFADVKQGAYYENALLWGEKNNICTGYPDVSSENFGVGKWVTRQDLFLMLMRYSELMGYKRSIDFGRSDDYSDYYDVDYEHWEAICWAATWNILHPKGDPNASKDKQRIDPYGRVSRTEFNTILRDMLDENGVSTAIPNVPNPSQDKWVQKDGKYYYYDKNGKKETSCYRDGYWLNADGSCSDTYCHGTWKSDSTGWWYEDNGWYPTDQWLKIDGYWYYFLSNGYMDYSEYRQGCWLNANGSWDERYGSGTWRSDSTGWWYTDGDWYPVSQYLWIDGYNYYFNSSGYLAE